MRIDAQHSPRRAAIRSCRAAIASASRAPTALAAQAVGIMEIWKLRGGARADGDDRSAPRRRAGPAHASRTRAAAAACSRFPGPPREKQVFFRTKDGRLIYLMRHAVYYEHLSKLLAFLDCSPDSGSIARGRGEVELRGARGRARRAQADGHDRAHLRGMAREPAGPASRKPRAGRDRAHRRRRSGAVHAGERARSPASGSSTWRTCSPGPVTSRVLAEQGADVIHVSAPHQHDPVHVVIDTGFGKRSTYIDLDRAEDVEILEPPDRRRRRVRPFLAAGLARPPRPVARASSPSAGPALIYVSVSCYGYDGPWAERAGYDPLGPGGERARRGRRLARRAADGLDLHAQRLSRRLSRGGRRQRALLRRAREGGSYHVKVSLTGASMWLQQLGQMPAQYWPDGPKAWRRCRSRCRTS